MQTGLGTGPTVDVIPGAYSASGYNPSLATNTSGVSWAAIFAGAVAAAALSLILVVLGFGLGLSSVSPWSQAGLSAGTIGISAIVWIIVTQLASAGVGGYIAGRLRSKWIGIHTDEVYFRDTAHGLLAWALATIVTVSLLAGGLSSVLSAGARTAGAAVGAGSAAALAAAAPMANGAPARGSDSAMTTGYFTDTLLRPSAPGAASPSTSPAPATGMGMPMTDGSDNQSRGEVGRIMLSGIQQGELDPGDRTYLAQVVASKTGLSQQDAQQRVDQTFARAKAQAAQVKANAQKAADDARKAAAYAALWMFVALLAGAFIASLMATIGGARRDHKDVLDARV